jgi:hypothetical protein
MHMKTRVISTISTLILLLIVSVFYVSGMVKGVSLDNNKLMNTKYNAMPNKEWKINFNKEVDLNTVNYDNVKVYDKTTGVAININIIKDYNDYKSFKIKPFIDYTKGRGYTVEMKNIKTKDNAKTLIPTTMDFYIKNIYTGLPGENGLIIIGSKAYSTEYLLSHSKEVNEIILNKGYDIYFTNDVSYNRLQSILKYGYLDGSSVTRKYDTITYIDGKGKNHIYIWDVAKEEYKLQPASIDLKIVVRSDVKLITVTPTNITAVPGAEYYKLKHSSSIKNFGETMAYTSTGITEEISILSSDKTELAKGYFSIQNNMETKCFLVTIDEYGVGNTSGNINNNGIVAADSEGYIYYSNSWDLEKLYKMGFDGLFNKKISEDKAQYINISKDYIYYSNYSNGGKLYKSELDGSKSHLLVDDKAAYITLSGDDIYYSNHSDGGKLYRVKKDGSDAVNNHGNPVMVDYNNFSEEVGEVAYISIDGDWIYYINHADGHKPYVINKEGTYRGKLSDEYATSLQVYGDSVYYCSGNGVISKVKKDGTEGVVAIKAKASEINKGFYINVMDEWLYYSNSEDLNKLYKIKTDGSGEKVKLSEESVGYINIVSGYIYYNTAKAKLFRLAINGNSNTKSEEVGGKAVIENILNMDNLKLIVDFKDVNEDIKVIEKKYLPEKVSAIMGDNIMKQLVVIWDVAKPTVKNGIRTYKGNAVGYNKVITLDLIFPSEMLNDTNKINVYNNNGENDVVEVVGIEAGSSINARRIQEGELIKIYSDEACKYELGEGKITRDKKVLIPKLDFDAYGKSIWITITRLGRAESAPTEVKQTEAPSIKENAAKDNDNVNLGIDVRDFTIDKWIASVKNLSGGLKAPNQYIYILPSKTILDMKNFEAKDSLSGMSDTSWNGAQLYDRLTGDKLELRKLDSKKTLFKAQNYDLYIATEYSGYGSPDSDGKKPIIEGMVSSDTPATVMIKDEILPKKPIIIEQRLKAGTEITLNAAPGLGETAWLIPVENLLDVKGWKWEDKDLKPWIEKELWDELYNNDGSNPYDPFKALALQNKDVTKLVGDGFNKIIKAPLGMMDGPNYVDRKYKLFIVNGVGASVEGGSSVRETNDSIIVDNQSSTLTLLSNIVVKSGEYITVKTSENVNMPEESEEARVFIINGNDNAYTINQLENSVKVGNGKVIKVQNKTSYKIDTTGLEATCDTIKQNYTIVVVDNAGNVSPVYYVSVMVKTDELKVLYDKAIESLDFTVTPTTSKDALSKMNSLDSYLPTVERILFNNQGVTKESQKNITTIFNSLKSKILAFIKLPEVGIPQTGIPVLDLDAPKFVKNPIINKISSTSIKLDINVRDAAKENAKAYYVVMLASSKFPDHELLINELNKSSDLVIARGEISNEELILKTKVIDISSLIPGEDYIVYIVLADDKLNYSTVVWVNSQP